MKSKWPKKYMKKAQHPCHKGNANQNHIKIPPYSCQNGYYEENKQQQMLARMWGKRNPHNVGEELIQPLWKTVWRLLKT
jgi:chorismate mutase